MAKQRRPRAAGWLRRGSAGDAAEAAARGVGPCSLYRCGDQAEAVRSLRRPGPPNPEQSELPEASEGGASSRAEEAERLEAQTLGAEPDEAGVQAGALALRTDAMPGGVLAPLPTSTNARRSLAHSIPESDTGTGLLGAGRSSERRIRVR